MKAIDLLRDALTWTGEGTARIVEDMRDAPLTQPTSVGGNHPLWVLGHLAFVEGAVSKILSGEPNPVDRWAPLFAPGTEPRADASLYPSFDEVLGTYRRLRAESLRRLDAIGDAGLDAAPAWVPPGFEQAMRTVGATFQLVGLHNMVHYGQIADARRAAGRKPLL